MRDNRISPTSAVDDSDARRGGNKGRRDENGNAGPGTSLESRVTGLVFFSPRFWGVAAALWTAGVLALALTPNAQSGWLMRTLGDKVLHGFAFLIGCLLWAEAIEANTRLTRMATALIGAAIALGIGLAVEAFQAYVPSRTADARDILADFLGILPALAYLTLRAALRRRRAA